MDFVHILNSHGHIFPSCVRLFILRILKSPRIWKVSDLVFIFNILFSFALNKMMATKVKKS